MAMPEEETGFQREPDPARERPVAGPAPILVGVPRDTRFVFDYIIGLETKPRKDTNAVARVGWEQLKALILQLAKFSKNTKFK